MNILITIIAASILGGGPDQPTDLTSQARKSVERSLPFLAEHGQKWIETKKCSSCHHVPMLLWSHHEAQKHQFTVNEDIVADMQKRMVAEYLGHPDFQPTGQDRSFTETKVGLGAVYLTLGLRAQERADADTETALAKMSQHFLDQQGADGSWKLKSSQPPLVDGDDVTTMMLLLALGRQSDTDGEARQRSLKWLNESDQREETQPLAMRAIVSATYGTTEDTEQAVMRLLSLQNDDGGWAQTKDRDSDALATGESLYALSMVDGNHHEKAVRKALEFLISSQQDDGSWLVRTRNPKGHDEIVTYYGTGWATIGIVRSLPK